MRPRVLRRSSKPSRAAKPSSRSNRTKSSFSYKELSSGDELEVDSSTPSPPPPKKRRIAPAIPSKPSSRPQTRALSQKTRSKRAHPRLKGGQNPRQKAVSKPAGIAKRHTEARSIPSDEVIPSWQTLPYEILLSIFQHALYPAHDDNLRQNPSVSWLVHASRTCKSFAEPALAALYESPPLCGDRPGGLQSLLCKDGVYIDYKSRIRRLEVDARRTLGTCKHGNFDLAELISSLPNLLGVHISEPYDRPPYRMITNRGRWHYSEKLLSSLTENGIRLKEWRWAGQMMGKAFPTLGLVHPLGPFQTLQKLSISHMDFPTQAPGTIKSVYDIFPEELACLSDLQSLSLESCYSDDWEILSQLPRQLKELSIINCSSLDSSVLRPFLFEHGASLQSLVLNHNHALDLSWLVDLKSSCPKLEVLRMDLTFFSSALLFQNIDADPVFESLLQPDEVPSWPSSLQEIEMINLRKWSQEAAVTFFKSLVNSATDLRFLKYLRIKAMLNISWRDRAGFREKWINDLRRTFLRSSSPPSPHLASFRAHRLWQEAIQRKQAEAERKESSGKSEGDRRVTRSAQNDEDGSNHEDDSASMFDHKMCEVVDIGIDNMRPTEMRMTEADFLDSEISGDEDWTGERSSPGPSYAW